MTNIEEIKPDFWIIQAACNDNPEDATDSSRQTYMIQGNITSTKIAELKVQLFGGIFMQMIGADMPQFLPPYYKTIYVPQR